MTSELSFVPPLVSGSDPFFLKTYEWEKFNFPFWRRWMKQQSTTCIIITATYISLVIIGRKIMENRKRLELKKPLIIWNALLATFSVAAFSRTFPYFLLGLLQPNGLLKSICSQDNLTYTFAFWAWLGTFSKVVELGDTFFVVLRKQPLIFLHPYHHATVLMYTWFTFESHDPTHQWYLIMNSGIHTLMYSYYALRAARINVPRKMAFTITLLQILQMFVGTYLNLYSLVIIRSNTRCDRVPANVYLGLSMYATYLALFVIFFVKSYFKKDKIK